MVKPRDLVDTRLRGDDTTPSLWGLVVATLGQTGACAVSLSAAVTLAEQR